MPTLSSVISILLLLHIPAFAQVYNWKIEVSDVHGHAIPGVHVLELGSKTGVVTNNEGRATIESSAKEFLICTFSFVGFEHKQDTLERNEDEWLKVTLFEEVHHIDEFLVQDHAHPGLDKPSTVDVGKEILEEQNKGTLINTLARIPGIQAVNVGVGISKPSIRGMSQNRVQVNNQGVKQEGQQWGNDHGLEIDQFDVSRVEIVKGASTIMFGSDAVGGVIQVLPPPIPRLNTINISLASLYKTNNLFKGNSVSIKANKNGYYSSLRFTGIDYADYRIPAKKFTYNGFVLPIHAQQLKNTAGIERNAKIELGRQTNQSNISFQVSYFSLGAGMFPGAIGIPTEYNLKPDESDKNIELPKQEITHVLASLHYKRYLKKGTAEFTVGFQQNERDELSKPHAHGDFISLSNLALRLHLQTISFDGKWVQKKEGRFQFLTGLSAQDKRNTVGGFEFLIPNFQRNQVGVWSLVNYDLNEFWQLEAGIRLDWVENSLEPFTDNLDVLRAQEFKSDNVNLAGALGIKRTRQNLTQSLTLNRFFRIPSIAELAANGIHHGTFRHEKGKLDLDPERGWQVEYGISQEWKDFSLETSLNVFGHYFENYIYLKPSNQFSSLPEAGQLYNYTQNKGYFGGGEWQFDQTFYRQLFKIGAGVEAVWNKNLDELISFPLTAPISGILELTYIPKKPYLPRVKVHFKKVLDQDRVDRNELTTEGYHLLDLGLYWNIKYRFGSISCSVEAQNAFDTKYLNHLSRYRQLNLPEQGRNWVFSIKIPFETKLKRD